MAFLNTAIQLSLRTVKSYLPWINPPQMSRKECPTFSPLKGLGFNMFGVKLVKRTFPGLEDSQEGNLWQPMKDLNEPLETISTSNATQSGTTAFLKPVVFVTKNCGFPQTPICLQDERQSLTWTLSRSFSSARTPAPPLHPKHDFSHNPLPGS